MSTNEIGAQFKLKPRLSLDDLVLISMELNSHKGKHTYIRRMSMKKNTLVTTITTALILFGSLAFVFAQQDYHDELILTYPKLKGTKIDKTCLCCHFIQEGTGPRNPYGVMYENEGTSDFAAFEKFDADGDGYTNIQEIGAKTYPGDFSDSPSPKKFKKCVTFFTSKDTKTKTNITVCVVGGKKVDIAPLGGAAYEKSGTIMVPWKPVVDGLGATAVFNAKDGKGRLDVKKGSKVVAQFWVGKAKGKLNGKDYNCKVAPELKGKNMFVSTLDLAVKTLGATESKITMGKIWNYNLK
jgi:hypothetical protein